MPQRARDAGVLSGCRIALTRPGILGALASKLLQLSRVPVSGIDRPQTHGLDGTAGTAGAGHVPAAAPWLAG